MPMPIGAITPDTIFFLPKYKNTIIAKQKLTTTLTNGINANKSKMAARIKIGQCLPIFSQKDSVAANGGGRIQWPAGFEFPFDAPVTRVHSVQVAVEASEK